MCDYSDHRAAIRLQTLEEGPAGHSFGSLLPPVKIVGQGEGEVGRAAVENRVSSATAERKYGHRRDAYPGNLN
jgi:hypothetical protein